jgi:membrane protease YdiL (CAAX protease family)
MRSIDIKPALRGRSIGIGTLALLLSMLFLALRAFSAIGTPAMRGLIVLMCVAMIALPWLLLSPHGRYQIGLKFPTSGAWFGAALATGVAAGSLCFVIGYLLYGTSGDNWFVSVARNYQAHPVTGMSLLQLHLTFTIAACLFSPIGEELFFRGFLQKVLEQRVSQRASTHLQSGLFALVHLCHHGIVVTGAGYALLPGSGVLWVLLMFALSWAFSWLRRASDSLLPAVLAHAAFNATMNSFIFAFLWAR